MGQAEQKLYVWAVCADSQSGASSPVMIHLGSDKSIQSVEFLKSWSKEKLDKLFPTDVQAFFSLYPSGRAAKMLAHLKLRQTYPDIPPLIILSATTLTPTPTEWLPYDPSLSRTGCGVGMFTATLLIKGTENLSRLDIAHKLFEIYLAHYKAPELGGQCKLEDFKVEGVQRDTRIDFLAKEQKVDFVSRVLYSVQIKEVPSDWVAGNGELTADGWIIHKGLIIGVTKFNDQYVLKLIGTGP